MEDNLPASVIIAGAGAVGVEFAYIMRNYGVDVTLVEILDRILPLEDAGISAELAKAFQEAGHQDNDGEPASTRLTITATGVTVSATAADGGQATLEAERVLQAIGFQPRVAGYGLENLGVALNEAGGIEIDEKMQTNVPNVYAIGDVTAKLMLAHVAETMGVVAAENIAGAPTVTLDFDMMPRATYCQPQVASFGYTAEQAEARGFDINVAKFPFQANGKARGMGDASGFVKLISDAKYGEILGAHLIGPDVTELLPELTLARSAELTPSEIARNVHAHPTLSEALKEAAHGLEGRFLNI